MLADGMRNASIRYDRSTIQITTATTIEVSHPLSFDRKARTCSRTTGAPPPPTRPPLHSLQAPDSRSACPRHPPIPGPPKTPPAPPLGGRHVLERPPCVPARAG